MVDRRVFVKISCENSPFGGIGSYFGFANPWTGNRLCWNVLTSLPTENVLKTKTLTNVCSSLARTNTSQRQIKLIKTTKQTTHNTNAPIEYIAELPVFVCSLHVRKTLMIISNGFCEGSVRTCVIFTCGTAVVSPIKKIPSKSGIATQTMKYEGRKKKKIENSKVGVLLFSQSSQL